jgi:threonine/homoserine/homoserine lactone efflux protein
MVGIICGMGVVAALTMLGLSVLVVNSKLAFYAVQALGGGYILYMGVRCVLSARTRGGEESVALAVHKQSFTYGSGLMLAVFNPKTILFFTSLLPSFIHSGGEPLAQSLNLTFILLVSTFSVHLIYASLGDYTSKFMVNQTEKIELMTGLFFIGIAVFIFLNGFISGSGSL